MAGYIPQISNLDIKLHHPRLNLCTCRTFPVKRESTAFGFRGKVSLDDEVWSAWRAFELDLNVSVVCAELHERVKVRRTS